MGRGLAVGRPGVHRQPYKEAGRDTWIYNLVPLDIDGTPVPRR